MAIPVNFAVCYAKFLSAGSLKPCYITMGIAASGNPGANATNTAWRAALTASGSSPFNAANMSNYWTLIETGCLTQMSATTQLSDVNLTPVVGTLTQETPAQNTTIIVIKETLFAGPRYRGRMAVPPCNIPETAIDHNGLLTGPALIANEAYWDYVYANLTGGGFNPYLLHEVSTAPSPSPVPPPTQITNLRVSKLVGTARRRLR